MRQSWKGIAVALVAVGCLLLGGCSGATGENVGGTATPPHVVVARETTGVPVPYREYELPPGGRVEGYGDRIACLTEPESVESGLSAIRLLDLQTGEHQRVVSCAVGSAHGFDILAARCSDTWLVWEEISGNEQDRPLDVRWRLYALPIAGAGTVGEPALVAEASTSAQSRPLFSVCADTVYWMTNSFANAEQEGAVDQARVWSRALPDSETKLLYTTASDAFSFSGQSDELLLTQAVDRNAQAAELVVLEPDTGAVREEIPLHNTTWLSHFTAYRDGMMAWAEGTDGGSAGDFWLRDNDGVVSLLSGCANDAVFVGRYLVYEAKPYSTKGVSTRVQHWRVCALDLETLEYVVVFDQELDVFGWSAPLAVAPRSKEYVMSRSVPPWITDEPTGTWVRIYTLG